MLCLYGFNLSALLFHHSPEPSRGHLNERGRGNPRPRLLIIQNVLFDYVRSRRRSISSPPKAATKPNVAGSGITRS